VAALPTGNVTFMADTAEEKTTPKPKLGPIVKRLKSFAGAHGGATAVVENLGRKGARIVLIGADGRWGDQVVIAGFEAATAACTEAGVEVKDEWERELVNGIKTNGYEWGLMGRGKALTKA
jgi:hypothetical protein